MFLVAKYSVVIPHITHLRMTRLVTSKLVAFNINKLHRYCLVHNPSSTLSDPLYLAIETIYPSQWNLGVIHLIPGPWLTQCISCLFSSCTKLIFKEVVVSGRIIGRQIIDNWAMKSFILIIFISMVKYFCNRFQVQLESLQRCIIVTGTFLMIK